MNTHTPNPSRLPGGTPRADMLAEVVKSGRQRRRQALIVTSAAAAVTGVTFVGIVVASAGTGTETRVGSYAGQPTMTYGSCTAAPPSTPLPGSRPAYTPKTARDWFMTHAQFDAYIRGRQESALVPSPRPLVPSPQPSGPLSSQLLDSMKAAGILGTSDFIRDEAASGVHGSLYVNGTLPDGSRLHVERTGAPDLPTDISGFYGDPDLDSAPDATLEGVPGTACEALLLSPHDTKELDTPLVEIVSPDGVSTVWTGTVSLAQLKVWAYAVARCDTDHPAN